MASLLLASGMAAATPSCGGEPGWAAHQVSGSITHPTPGKFQVGARYFTFNPSEFGWRIGMLDSYGLEIPMFAAPVRPVETNPLNLAGWHFRNRDNSGPNVGNVNAPQRERLFKFGTMATNAANNPGLLTPALPAEGFGGLGVLSIDDFTLTPPEPGQRAGFMSITFSVCLIWQGGGERLDPIVESDPGVAFERVVATMRGCGLDTSVYRLSDRMSKGREGAQRPFLEPDLDGDDIPDLVVPVTRKNDATPGLAICLIGNESIVIIGYTGRIGKHFDPAYFNSADGWQIHRGQVYPSPEEGPPPTLSADAILLSKEESSSVLLYLDQNLTVSSYWQGD